MSKQLFVNNANAVPAADNGDVKPTDIAAGRIAAFDVDDFASGSLDLTALTTAERIVFVQGAASGEDPIVSSIINVSDVKKVVEKAYVAPTAQVSTVTAETESGIATIRIIRADLGYRPDDSFTVSVDISGLSAANAATALANAINAVGKDWVTATTSTADIVLTASAGVSFETALDDLASDWNLAATTTPNFGSGTSAHIKQIEDEAYGGNFTNRIYLPIAPPSYVVDGETYDIFTILVKTNTTPNISRAATEQQIILAIQATASGIDLPVFFGFEEAAP